MRRNQFPANIDEPVKWHVLSQLWPYLLEFKRRVALALLCLVAAKLASIGLPYVLKYTVDSDGNLVRSEIARSNRDRTTEATALATLRKSAPFPKPSPHLLRNGRLEMHESWLFNNDGRFQLRSLALVQMSE